MIVASKTKEIIPLQSYLVDKRDDISIINYLCF